MELAGLIYVISPLMSTGKLCLIRVPAGGRESGVKVNGVVPGFTVILSGGTDVLSGTGRKASGLPDGPAAGSAAELRGSKISPPSRPCPLTGQGS